MTTHTLLLALFFFWLFPSLALTSSTRNKKYSIITDFVASGITIAVFYGFLWGAYVVIKYLF